MELIILEVFLSSGIFTWQSENMEKLSPKYAELFLRNKYTVFTMGYTGALRSVKKKISGELQICSYVCARVSIEVEVVVCL